MVLSRRGFLAGSLALCGAMPLSLAACSSAAGEDDGSVQASFFCFDTLCSLGGSMERATLDAAVRRCQGFEQTLSRTIATSDVGRVNAAGGKPTAVDEATAELVELALGYCEESGGLFDITIGAVSELWDFRDGVVPSEEAVAQALPHVGWQGVHVDRSASTVTLADPKARLDLGGIAKGYVTDVVVGELAAAGVTSAYVNLGGNVAVLGAKPDGSPWSVGVRDPLAREGEERSVALVRTDAGSVVTSGLYERQFEADGQRYWHILDPRTGYPVQTDVVSASVFAERSLDGDGYTKPVLMLGREAGLAFARQRGLDVLIVGQDGTTDTLPTTAFELL